MEEALKALGEQNRDLALRVLAVWLEGRVTVGLNEDLVPIQTPKERIDMIYSFLRDKEANSPTPT